MNSMEGTATAATAHTAGTPTHSVMANPTQNRELGEIPDEVVITGLCCWACQGAVQPGDKVCGTGVVLR